MGRGVSDFYTMLPVLKPFSKVGSLISPTPSIFGLGAVSPIYLFSITAKRAFAKCNRDADRGLVSGEVQR